jgi:hypothetical protein
MESETTPAIATEKPKPPKIEFLSPLQIRSYRAPEGSILVGDNHIVRGAVFVIGGAPGVGKSRASVALAVSGALGKPWMGLPIPRPFRTMIIQNENGRSRLSEEFFTLPCEQLESHILVSPPPPCGIAFTDPDFRTELMKSIELFKPDLVLIDPWNSVAPDDKARDYLETFQLIRRIFPSGDNAPAIGIVAHTRKPKHEERPNGRMLLNLLAGSYVLASVPRAVFVLQPASDDTEDSRVVFTCCKNNDGPLGAQSAWHRRNGFFEAILDFNWDEFHRPNPARSAITEANMAEIFDNGGAVLSKSDAVTALMKVADCGKSAAYAALDPDGRFKSRLRTEGSRLRWAA